MAQRLDAVNALTDEEISLLKAFFTPVQPKPCKFCKWPGTFHGVCDVCVSLIETLQYMRTRIYWLEVTAREQRQRRRLFDDD